MKGRGILGLALASVIAALAFGMETGRVEAAPDVVYITPSAGLVGSSNSTVELLVSDISALGLGAWTVDVTHDASVVEFVSCFGQSGSVCGPSFGPETTRITGASEAGIYDTGASLATLTYRCLSGGTSQIALDVVVFATADGQKVEPLDVVNGSIDCLTGDPGPDATPTATTQPSLPPSGTGPTGTWGVPQWALALLTAAGASLVALAALRKDRVS